MSLLFILVGAAVLAGAGYKFHTRLAALEAKVETSLKADVTKQLVVWDAVLEHGYDAVKAAVTGVKADIEDVKTTV